MSCFLLWFNFGLDFLTDLYTSCTVFVVGALSCFSRGSFPKRGVCFCKIWGWEHQWGPGGVSNEQWGPSEGKVRPQRVWKDREAPEVFWPRGMFQFKKIFLFDLLLATSQLSRAAFLSLLRCPWSVSCPWPFLSQSRHWKLQVTVLSFPLLVLLATLLPRRPLLCLVRVCLLSLPVDSLPACVWCLPR